MKTLIKGFPDGEYSVQFKHCGHEITIELEEREKSIR